MLNEEQKTALLAKLDIAEHLFLDYYRAAQQLGIHTFIEHTGFMNEHLKILRKAVNAGIDIEMLNNHNDTVVKVEPYEADYLAEKFACMFAPILKDKKSWRIFVESAENKGCGERP